MAHTGHPPTTPSRAPAAATLTNVKTDSRLGIHGAAEVSRRAASRPRMAPPRPPPRRPRCGVRRQQQVWPPPAVYSRHTGYHHLHGGTQQGAVGRALCAVHDDSFGGHHGAHLSITWILHGVKRADPATVQFQGGNRGGRARGLCRHVRRQQARPNVDSREATVTYQLSSTANSRRGLPGTPSAAGCRAHGQAEVHIPRPKHHWTRPETWHNLQVRGLWRSFPMRWRRTAEHTPTQREGVTTNSEWTQRRPTKWTEFMFHKNEVHAVQ